MHRHDYVARSRRVEVIVLFGGDALALRVCEELIERDGRRVAVLWEDSGDFAARVEACGATFVPRSGDERAALLAAGILEAETILAIADNDHDNLQYALTARDLNPGVRVVLRQFNRTLGRKIEQNLTDCSVVSLSSHSAATYASAAVDPACFSGLQFPDIDGPLVGFFERSGSDAGFARSTPAEIEARFRLRVVARDGDPSFNFERPIGEHETLVLFGRVKPISSGATRSRPRAPRRLPSLGAALRAGRRLDPLVRWLVVAIGVAFAGGCAFFARVLHLDALTAAYFVVATMTTTGYGDISPRTANGAGQAGAIVLMIAGVVLSGILIAIGSSLFTRVQYASLQGLRRISRRGHVIVCGAGNVGSRVIEFLVRLGCTVVVIEASPKPETVEGSRARQFDLLTADATKDSTLDLCNIGEAAALVALTNSDTMNLEIALGARARNAALPIVMRVQHETFEKSVRRHFGIYRTYGTAALAAPIFVGLSKSSGTRGRVTVGACDYRLVEYEAGGLAGGALRQLALCAWRDGDLVFLHPSDDVRAGERILTLERIPNFRPDGAPPHSRASEAGRS